MFESIPHENIDQQIKFFSLLSNSLIELNMTSPNIFEDIFEAYQKSRYCDLEICGLIPSLNRMKPILCHKLVVCSFIPQWKDFITEDIDHISLPDFEHEDLLEFFNLIYESLLPGRSHRLKDLNDKILTFLGINKFRYKFDPSPEPSEPDDEVVMKPEPVSEMYANLEDALSLFHDSSEESEDPLLNSKADSSSPIHEQTIPDAPNIDIRKRKLSESEEENPTSKRKLIENGEKSLDLKASKALKSRLKAKQTVLVKNHEMMQSLVQSKSIDTEKVRHLLKGECHGPLNVDVTTPTVEALFQWELVDSFTERKDAFFALIGAQKLETEWVGQSLAWTSDDPSVLKAHYETIIPAFQSVFGLPKTPLLGASPFLASEGTGRWSARQAYQPHDLYRKFTYQSTREDLEKELNRPELAEGFVVTPPTRKDLDLPLSNYTIRMTDNLDVFDDILLVGVYPHGVEVREISLPKFIRHTPERMLCRILTIVWVGGSNKIKFKADPSITEICKANARLNYTKKKIKKLLASDEVLPKPLPKVMCDICGKNIQENACMTNMLFHRQTHDIQQFQCECDITFTSLAHKKRHFDVVHCSKKPKKKQVYIKKLDPKVREKSVCETCGKVFKSMTYLRLHMDRRHGIIQCERCHQMFKTAITFKLHCEEAHPELGGQLPGGKFPCADCEASFSTKTVLSRHIKNNHAPKTAKCGICEKSFTKKVQLKYHALSVHVKSRPFVCRSEGCNSSFNYSGNLYAHEKKLHGGAFGKATPIDDVISDKLLQDLGCIFEVGTKEDII